jgi:hypothetical protein
MRNSFISFIMLLSLINVSGQHVKSVFDYINETEGVPVIKIETTWSKLINQKLDEAYIPAKVEVPGPGGKTLSFDAKVRARGMMRKQVCFFPPIKIDFKKGDLLKNGVDTATDKVKVVFQCRTGAVNAEYLVKEKLCYDLYKIINPDVNVRVKQVKYDCIENGKTKYSLDGLVVEDEVVLAERYNGKVIDIGKVGVGSLDKDIYQRMTVFQYMIANTDWSIPNKHNTEMIKVPNIPKVVPIAYDFDYAGLVGTPYAVPYETLPITSVFERYYMGHGITEADALALGKYFMDKKPALLKAVADVEGLDEKGKAAVNKFLAPFFDIVASEKQIKRTFVRE